MSTTYGEINTSNGKVKVEKYMTNVKLELEDGTVLIEINSFDNLKELISALDIAGSEIWHGWHVVPEE